VIARAVEAALLAQLSQEFRDGSLQIASPTALLQHGDLLGRQSRGDLGNSVARNIGKPAGLGYERIAQSDGVQLHCPLPLTLISLQQGERWKRDDWEQRRAPGADLCVDPHCLVEGLPCLGVAAQCAFGASQTRQRQA